MHITAGLSEPDFKLWSLGRRFAIPFLKHPHSFLCTKSYYSEQFIWYSSILSNKSCDNIKKKLQTNLSVVEYDNMSISKYVPAFRKSLMPSNATEFGGKNFRQLAFPKSQ
jgi:hypothetical protein